MSGFQRDSVRRARIRRGFEARAQFFSIGGNRGALPPCSSEWPAIRIRGSGCGEQVDNSLYGSVGAMISGFETAVGAMLGIRTMMEVAVG